MKGFINNLKAALEFPDGKAAFIKMIASIIAIFVLFWIFPDSKYTTFGSLILGVSCTSNCGKLIQIMSSIPLDDKK